MASRTMEVAKENEIEKDFTSLINEKRGLDIWEAIQSLGGETPIEITIHRVRPKMWNNKVIEGELGKYTEKITSEDIKEQWGGGSYRIQFKAADKRGVYRDVNSTILKIAGDPIIPGDNAPVDHGSNGNSNGETTSLVKEILRHTEERTKSAEARAEKLMDRADPSVDFLKEQVLRLQTQLHDREERLLEAAGRPSRAGGDDLLGKFLDGESGRMTALRQQHENELRMKSEMHKDEIQRLNHRFDTLQQDAKSAHEREVSNLKFTYDTQMQSMMQSQQTQLGIIQSAHQSQIDGLKREIAHLSRLYETAQAEIVELRTRKERSLLEQMTELGALKEAFEGFGGGAGEESTFERIASSVAPMLEGIAGRIGASAQPQHQIQQQMPQQKPQIRELEDGTFETADGRRLQRKKKKPADPLAVLPDSDLQGAVVFFENGLNNGAEPAEFARTVRSLVPQISRGEIREVLGKPQGVDALLARVSKLSPDSPLLTQHGRNWVRKVIAEVIG